REIVARRSVPDDGNVTEPRMARVEIAPCEAEPLQRRGPARRDEEIGRSEQRVEPLAAVRRFQIEGYHLDPPRELRVPAWRPRRQRVARGRFHFDDRRS